MVYLEQRRQAKILPPALVNCHPKRRGRSSRNSRRRWHCVWQTWLRLLLWFAHFGNLRYWV